MLRALMDWDDAGGFDMRGLIETSLLEWDDNVSAVVIAGGCNLRCPYCHSWRYVTGLSGLEPLSTDVLFSLLERQEGWIDGVVVTGGEPTLQPGLADLLARIREYDGVKIKLHTNGTRPEIVEGLLRDGLVDCLALDYKAPLDSRFFAAAGVREDADILERVRKTFRLAAASQVDREYHTTLDPEFVTPETLTEMAAGLEPGGVWYLQQFENSDCLDRSRLGARRYDGAELDGLEGIARAGHGKVIVKRGRSA